MNQWSLENDLAEAVRSGKFTRRQILQRAAGLGIGAMTASTILAACGGDDDAASGTTTAGTGTGTQPSGTNGQGRYGGNFVFPMYDAGGVENFDPSQPVTDYDIYRTELVFGYYVDGPAAQDGWIPPGVLESIEPNEDASVWNLRVRPDVVFHDGKPLTAEDVLYSIRRILDPDVPNGGLQFIAAAGIRPGDSSVLGELELELVLERPYASLVENLRLVGGPVQEGATVESLNENPIGTGPFKFVEAPFGEFTLLERNENYWEEGLPYYDSVQLLNLDIGSRINALESGQINWVEADLADAQRLEADGFKVVPVQGGTYVAFFMMRDLEPFTDKRVMDAFKLAVDRDAMVTTLYGGAGAVGNDIFGFGQEGYDDSLPQRAYDPDAARALLAEAGYPDGIEVTLVTSDGAAAPEQLAAAEAFAEHARAAGITINLQTVPVGDYWNEELSYKREPFYQTNWGANTFPQIAGNHRCDTGERDELGWGCVEEYDALLDQANAEPDPQRRLELFHEAQKMLWEDGGYIIAAWGDQQNVMSPNVDGVHPALFRNYIYPTWFSDA